MAIRLCFILVAVISERGMWLVDCGYEGSLPFIDQELSKHNLTVGDLTGILISHDDIDHVGGLYEFKAFKPSLSIGCSNKEEPFVSGRLKSMRLKQAEQMLESLPVDYKPWARSFQFTAASDGRFLAGKATGM